MKNIDLLSNAIREERAQLTPQPQPQQYDNKMIEQVANKVVEILTTRALTDEEKLATANNNDTKTEDATTAGEPIADNTSGDDSGDDIASEGNETRNQTL